MLQIEDFPLCATYNTSNRFKSQSLRQRFLAEECCIFCIARRAGGLSSGLGLNGSVFVGTSARHSVVWKLFEADCCTLQS